jgi:hypothetical protein
MDGVLDGGWIIWLVFLLKWLASLDQMEGGNGLLALIYTFPHELRRKDLHLTLIRYRLPL